MNWYILVPNSKKAPELVLESSMFNFVFYVPVTGKYGVEGKLKITQPMFDYRTLTANDLADKTSADYNFLITVCTGIASTEKFYLICNSWPGFSRGVMHGK